MSYETAIERLWTFIPKDGYYVAFSGGKDSIVVLDLVRRSGVKHDVHFNMTTVDPPELLKFIRTHYPDIEMHLPETTMLNLIPQKLMPPTRRVRYCCEYLKERGGSGRTVVTGIRWAESAKRSLRHMVETCYKDKTKRYVNPIIDWSDTQVWMYIQNRKLAYPSLYDEGFHRIGCIGCPISGASGMLRDFRRWPGYRKMYLLAFKKMLAHRTERGLKTKWQSPEEVMAWWIGHQKGCPDQGILFE